jgi:tripartite-type tricarboxylate transporter receptor subunit TctC
LDERRQSRHPEATELRKMCRFRGYLYVLLAGSLLAAGSRAVEAQPYPSKPIRIVVGYAAGGAADITARLVAQKLSVALGQPVVIDNRPGAGGIIAGETVAKAEPDGHSLLHMNYGNAVSVALFKSLPYDIERDFAPISPMGFFDVLVLVNKGSPLDGVRDVVAAANATPDRINVGTVSIGSGQHMAAELFKAVAGANLTIVPFKSTPALVAALKNNDIQVAFEIAAPVMSLVKSGELKALAVSSRKRFSGLPDVPTVLESGIANYDVTAWNGVAAPAKTPRAIVDRLNKEINAVLALPEIRQKFQELGIDARGGSPEDLEAILSSEIVKWKQLASDMKLEKR